MNLHCKPSRLHGCVEIPGSKSHTIRAVAIASLANGSSRIRKPLHSADTAAAVRAYRALGADIDDADGDLWSVQGLNGTPRAPIATVDVQNSGTTMNVALGSCALLREGAAHLTGDAQIQRRPSGQLAQSLNDLGASVTSDRDNGCAPFTVRGRLRGGRTRLEAVSSQYLSSLLMATPLADGVSEIEVPLLNERPYVGITLEWLDRQGIAIDANDDWSHFRVKGGQTYRPVDRRIPADFSSATFFLAAGALGDNEVVCDGLDYADTQGDKAVVMYLERLGARIAIDDTSITVRSGALVGCELDLNATPDTLPMMAALACYARGETRLVNVPQARFKETDRITVMREELTKLGADIEELPDGLVVRERPLTGGVVDGRDDHRVVMALAIAASAASDDVLIEGAEAMRVTYPAFADDLAGLGADIRLSAGPATSARTGDRA